MVRLDRLAGGLLALALLLAVNGCASVRRTLGLDPAGPPPGESPLAPFAGLDRLLSPPGDGAGTLARVTFPGAGITATVAPGDSVVLLDLEGPAVVRRIRLTLASADPHWLRRVALRMHWEGEVQPSVHVPLGDFFATPFERTPYASLATGVVGESFYAWLPMPFVRRARIVLENGSDLAIEGLSFEADVEAGAALIEPVATLHALWSRDPRPQPDRRHVVLDVGGAGWFAGTTLAAQGHAGSFAFLRGDGLFRVDGAALDSSTVATYLGAGLAAPAASGAPDAPAGPFQGAASVDPARGRIAAYRWHLADPIPFRRSFLLELERGPANREGAEYATVAFWYQTEPHEELPPLPGPHQRRAPDVVIPPGAVRADELEVIGTGAGTLRMTVPVPRPDRYEVVVFAEASPGARDLRVTVGSAQEGRPLDVSPPGAEPGDVLPGVIVDTVAVTARALELQLAASGGGIAMPAAVELRPVLGWADRWWTIGSWPIPPGPGATDAQQALRYVWGPDRDPDLQRAHELPGGAEAAWTPRDAGADGRVALAPRGGTAYAQAFLYAPRERGVLLVLERTGAAEVWVEGVPALERPAPRPGTAAAVAGEIELDAYLRAGWNRVLVKLAALGPGRFRLRAADPDGELSWARTPLE